LVYYSVRMAETIDDLKRLSVRERQVANCVARGLRDKEIATELGIEPGTVKTHLTRIFTKLRANRLQVALAVRADGWGPNRKEVTK
jgi:DNA-binding NarL/FixJ family response regulator